MNMKKKTIKAWAVKGNDGKIMSFGSLARPKWSACIFLKKSYANKMANATKGSWTVVPVLISLI